MLGVKYLSLVVAGLAVTVSGSAIENDWMLALLKRQEPGSPAYACHSACGASITLSRGNDPCNDQAFLTNYASCLDCAGPDKINIWRYYGATLSTAGAKCGLSTAPGSPSAGPTTPSTTASTNAGASTTSPTSQFVTASASSWIRASVTTTDAIKTPSPVSVSTQSTATVSSSPIQTIVTTTISSIAPTGTRPGVINGTATTTSTQFTGAANSLDIFGTGVVVGVAILAVLV